MSKEQAVKQGANHGRVTSELPFEKFLACVHCGLCTSACPTYLVVGSEADSPRGRIHLMRSVAEGRIDWTPDVVKHIDRCLDCRACVTACPSGVEYGLLIEDAREQLEKSGSRPLRQRVLTKVLRDWLFPYPKRMRLAIAPLRLMQRAFKGRERTLEAALSRLPGRLGGMAALVPPPPAAQLSGDDPGFLADEVRARGPERYRVALLTGCVNSVLFEHVNRATARVLSRNGCTVVIPRGQVCCGALHAHTGAKASAQAFARKNIEAFERAAGGRPFDAILVNAAGCGSTLKEYGHLLKDDPEYAERAAAFSARMKDITEFIAGLPLDVPPVPPTRVTYHDACHLLHGQGVSAEPRKLLQAIPGVELVPLEETEVCCGSAGIYNITQPELAQSLLNRKMDHVVATKASILATANPGCTLQIYAGVRQRGIQMEVVHPIELLDRAYEGRWVKAPTSQTNGARGSQQKQGAGQSQDRAGTIPA